MFKKIKIIHKIYFLGFSLFALILLVGLVGLSKMKLIGDEIMDIAEIDMPLNNIVTQITEHQLAQVIELERSVLYGTLLKYRNDPNYKKDMAKHIKEMQVLSKKIEGEILEAEELVEKSIDFAHSETAKNKLTELAVRLKQIEKDFFVAEEESFMVADMLEANDLEGALTLLPTLEKHQDALDKELIATLADIQNFTLAAALQAEHDEIEAINLITGLLIGSIILAILLPILISRSISKPIGFLQSRLEEITKGDGDLTLRINNPMHDEIGEVSHAFDTFIDQLASTIRRIAASTASLENSSSTALRIMEETQASINTHQGETSTVSNAVAEMNTATQEVALNTASAATKAEKVKESVEKGKISADETKEIIRDMANEVTRTSEDIETLAKETESIGTVLDAIRGIAEQTNLLALNAAIEAARAGETGRGFAVVADEVRSLAQRTQESTVDIQELVEKLQQEASKAVSSMQNGNKKTEACLEKSMETSQAFDDAYEAVSEISDLNIQIATAIEEQSQVTEEITKNLKTIQEIAISTTEGAEHTAVSNQQITHQVIELNNNIHQFKV